MGSAFLFHATGDVVKECTMDIVLDETVLGQNARHVE
jgi:hypothetical protein